MKARFIFLAAPLMVGVALAQAGGSGSQSGQTGPEQQPGAQAPQSSTASTANSGTSAEMKTMTYKGTLVDLGCGGGAQTAATAKSTAAATPDESAPASNSANRSAGDTSSCAASASTSQFGLKTDSGQVYRFDLVGNQRAQDEFKSNKHWNNAGANKPLKVRISGVLQGDKLIVSSIH